MREVTGHGELSGAVGNILSSGVPHTFDLPPCVGNAGILLVELVDVKGGAKSDHGGGETLDHLAAGRSS